jgi:protein-S-isoprenylcysteine O-methyltransferase Ste14
MRTLGWMVALGGLVLSVRSTLLLLGRGRPKRGPNPAFVIAGPYCRTRNPLFAGLLLVLGGLAMATGVHGLAEATTLVALGLHLWLIRVEEPRLRARFGDAYEAYLVSVPRWIPRLKAPAD